MKPTIACLALCASAVLAGCNTAPYQYRSDLELTERPGMFSGPKGVFTLHGFDYTGASAAPVADKVPATTASEYEEFQRWRGSRDAAEQREFEDWRAWREWKRRQGQ